MLLQQAWDKYGEKAFIFSKLVICDRSELIFFEQSIIDAYKPAYNVYRITDGSRATPALIESRKKLSLANSGNKNPMFGRSGHLAPMFGITHTAETRKKISLAKTGKKLSEEHRLSMSIARLGKMKGSDHPSARPVLCVEVNMTFDTGGLAIEWLRKNGKNKASQSAISAACLGKYKSAYGYHWRYADYP